PDKYPIGTEFPAGTRIEHRRSLDKVQRDLREIGGVSVLIYDQTCAAEKRRRRKRGRMADPSRRVFINSRVCEGCGDCNAKSNCMSVLPHDTAFGRKRRIDQSACNKDYSCAEGFCPSFVSVIGGRPRRAAAMAVAPGDLPEPALATLADDRPFNLLVAGVGGTGVVTIGAILTMGAHIEGKAFSTVDQFGMAQKGGAVTSHIRIASSPEAIRAVRLNAGAADLVLGCDSLVTGDALALSVMAPGKTHVLVNTHEQITGEFTRNPDLAFPAETLAARIGEAAGDNVVFQDVSRLATRLLGDSIGSNLMLLGVAYQMGLLPVGADAIQQAIELNGVAVKMNRDAFAWGRRLALDPDAVAALVEDAPEPNPDWHAELTAYQNDALADRHAALVEKVRTAEAQKAPGMSGLADAVARNAYRLMAYKDEYEVARLHSDPAFHARLREAFEGNYSLAFHLAPPLLASRDTDTGRPRKLTFGPWMQTAFRLLAKLKGLRGTPFDPFGHTAERRRERAAIGEYEATVVVLLDGLTPESHALAVEIASLPSEVRGYGHVKQAADEAVRTIEADLLAVYRDPTKRAVAAE
ncbi:MAG: 2-oxoacid:acceptor oxidoreductase family protein, partial [Alphaproteobacteria bacterium]|nr:2-oxoacid:acceptor oxidoreductase family protein [Alphaproteobacteria bacterium]